MHAKVEEEVFVTSYSVLVSDYVKICPSFPLSLPTHLERNHLIKDTA